MKPKLPIPPLAAALFVLAACSPADPSAAAQAGSGIADGPPRGLVVVSPPSPIISPGEEERRADRPFFHDFGHVAYGELVEHDFKLVNTDLVPVVVRDLLPSCGCTTPRMTVTTEDGRVVQGRLKGEPVITIPPGAKATLTVRIDTNSIRTFNRDKLETVRLRCDSEHTPFLGFEAHILVRRLFQAQPSPVDLGLVPASAGGRDSTRITSLARGTQAAIVGVDSVEGPLLATVSEGLLLDTPLWTLQVEVEPGLPLGALTGAVHLAAVGADGEPAEPFTVEVLGQIVADVVVEPPALHLLQLGGSELRGVEARLRCLIPGSRVKVLAGRLDGPVADRLRFEAVPLEPDGAGRAAQWRLRLNPDPSLGGTSFEGTLTLELDDPTVTTLELPYASRAVP